MKRGIIFNLIIIFCLNFVSASVMIGNLSENIKESYSPNEILKGWINLSIKNEKNDIRFSIENEKKWNTTLLDALTKTQANYKCDPADCKDYYIAENGAIEKTFSLNNEEKILVFNVRGKNIDVKGLTFKINVSNTKTCISPPLILDFLDDESIEWKAQKVGDDFSCFYENYKGCFNESANIDYVRIDQSGYCEKITLPPSSKFYLGTWLKGNQPTWYNTLFRMSLIDMDGEEVASCNIEQQPSNEGSIVGCTINYENYERQNYFVCISASESTNYLIKRENEGNNCGFYNLHNIPQTFSYDYYLFAKGAAFENIGVVDFDAKKIDDGYLLEQINDYINFKYKGNCSNGCAIPIKFKAKNYVNITISNITLDYSTEGGIPPSEKNIYDARTEKATISTDGYILLDLEKLNITSPSRYGNHTLSFYIGDKKILTKKITIEKVPIIKSLKPLSITPALPVYFEVEVESPSNATIVKYYWDFGDNSTEETETNTTLHIYMEIKPYYEVKIKVRDENGLEGEKSFIVVAGNVQEAVNKTLKDYKNRINNITLEIENMGWYADLIKKLLDLENVKNVLNELERKYNQAGGDEETYLNILYNLTQLNIPYSIEVGEKIKIPYLVDFNSIDLSVLKESDAGTYDSEYSDEYKKAIVSWINKNLESEAEIEYIQAYYENEILTLATKYNLNIKPKQQKEIKNFIVFKNAKIGNNFLIKNGENKKIINDNIIFSFDNLKERNFEFIYSGSILLNESKVYFSPKFSELEIITEIKPCNFNGICEKDKGENEKNCRADCKPWKKAILIWAILFFSAFIVYIFLSQWYRVNYEKHLFKNRADVYNLMSFVGLALSQGMNINEIKRKLKESGWNNEQISYIIRKYSGKGIVPLDISGFFARRKIKKTTKLYK